MEMHHVTDAVKNGWSENWNGYKYKKSNLQAALGLAQLERPKGRFTAGILTLEYHADVRQKRRKCQCLSDR